MIENMIKLDDLYKKYPFIYETDGDYYYIGWGICKQCSSSIALDYYKLYKKTLNEIGEEKVASRNNDIDEEMLDTLLWCFRKVKAYSDIAVDNEDLRLFRGKIENFICSLSDEQQRTLLEQLRNFVNVFYYYYRRF